MSESPGSPLPTVSARQPGFEMSPHRIDPVRELAVREQQRFDQVFDFSADALLLTDPRGSIHKANTAAASLLQLTKSQLQNITISDLVSGELKSQFHATLQQLVPSSITRVYKTLFALANGQALPVLLRVTACADDDCGAAQLLWQIKCVEEHRPEPAPSIQATDPTISALHQIVSEFAGESTLSVRLQKVADRLMSLLQAQSFLIYLYEPQREELELEVAKGVPSIPGTHIRLGEGIIGIAAQDRQPMLMDAFDGWTSEAATDSAPRPVVVVPMLCLNELMGVMAAARSGPSTRPFTSDDANLVSIFAAMSGMMIASMRSAETLGQETERRKQAEQKLRAAHKRIRTMAAKLEIIREEERTVLARQVHDELGQILTSFKLDLSWLAKNQQAILDKSKDLLKLSDSTIESVQRISTELRPGVLDELGLIGAMDWQAQDFQMRSGIECYTNWDADDERLDRNIATAIFRIFQEALTNIARHAHASRIDVELKEEKGHLVLTVKDNGTGIDEAQINSSKSLGLIGMRERAQIFGGKIDISGAPGKGTRVTARLPLRRTAGEESK